MTAQQHLKRLALVWEKAPAYFITTCVSGRQRLLANAASHEILRMEWVTMRERHGWAVGRYVVMPDHVHFFVVPSCDRARPLSAAIGKWKEWTAKRILNSAGLVAPLWQPEFF